MQKDVKKELGLHQDEPTKEVEKLSFVGDRTIDSTCREKVNEIIELLKEKGIVR